MDDDREVEPIPQRSPATVGRTLSGRAPIPSAAQDAHGSQAARDAVANFNDGILYVGLNEKSVDTELRGLRATNAPVTSIRRTDESTAVHLDGVAYDLAKSEDVKAFAGALVAKHGLLPTVAPALADALVKCEVNGRDELAQVAMTWASGEAGKPIPSRVVISGHHGESGYLGSFTEDDLRHLAHALPNAAKQIEDIHFSGCMTEGNVNLRDELRAAFPNVRTMWGYSGLAPKAPVAHLQAWQKATKGRAEIRSASVPSRENAVAWSRDSGVVGKQRPIAERLAAYHQADGRFDGFKSGRLGDHDAMHVDYEAYQAIAQAPAGAVTDQERSDAATKGAVMLRLRKYGYVREEFAKAHGARIAAACAKAGIEAPHLEKLSRHDALERIAAIKEKVATADPGLRDVLDGFVDLRSDIVKQEWCNR